MSDTTAVVRERSRYVVSVYLLPQEASESAVCVGVNQAPKVGVRLWKRLLGVSYDIGYEAVIHRLAMRYGQM